MRHQCQIAIFTLMLLVVVRTSVFKFASCRIYLIVADLFDAIRAAMHNSTFAEFN